MTDTDTTLPAPPANAVEAQNRIAALSADRDWGARLTSGDAATTREFHDLAAMASTDDATKVTLAMSGAALGSMPTGELHAMAGTAAWLRELGIRDEIVRDTLSRKAVTQAEFDATKAWHQRHMADKAWAQKYIDGDVEAREKMALASIILSSPVEGDVYSGWVAPPGWVPK